jgi:DNA-binding winged helix-turn-helix (wHTH) protein/TolB-like protein
VERQARTVRIGDFEFAPETGDLRRVSPPPGGATVRLPPQPAKLLALLLSRRGDLVDRDEIRRALWPDTHVDVDQSLAFCVRQLRAALGDSGSSPVYIETLPRRGFRLIARAIEPTAVLEAKAEPSVGREAVDAGSSTRRRSSTSTTRRARVRWALAILVLVVLASVLVHLSRRVPHDGTRLAIMPFELAASVEEKEERSHLALLSESLMVDLARDGGGSLDVVGPRTTAKYHGTPFPDLDALASELEIDYVLNARYLDPPAASAVTESAPVLIVELIRLEDRAHPWVERFDGERSPSEIAATVAAAVRRAIAAQRSH